ncbi:SLCO4A1 isoform 6, partial [Pongo abelii]
TTALCAARMASCTSHCATQDALQPQRRMWTARRCVRDPQRSFALGIQWIVVRILGGIPGPIAFGWVIDKACLLWQDQCGQQGSCLVYQNSAMSRYILIMGLLYKVLGVLFFAIACCLYKPLSESSDGLETCLPNQSSAPNSATDSQLQSSV